jgi:hypothetical protein
MCVTNGIVSKSVVSTMIWYRDWCKEHGVNRMDPTGIDTWTFVRQEPLRIFCRACPFMFSW